MWDILGSPDGLDVVLVLLARWLPGAAGLYELRWPWDYSRPPHAIQWTLTGAAPPKPLDERDPRRGFLRREGAAQRCHERGGLEWLRSWRTSRYR